MVPMTPCLWFDGNAEEAVEFYVEVFRDSRIVSVERYPEATAELAGHAPGEVMTINFELQGRPFMALNAGPEFKFTPAISFMASCADQAEIDRCWDALGDGGEPMACGWVTDRFGITWQVIPDAFSEMMESGDGPAIERMMTAMLHMVKLDVAVLRAAFEGD